jgi:hypothetical protein
MQRGIRHKEKLCNAGTYVRAGVVKKLFSVTHYVVIKIYSSLPPSLTALSPLCLTLSPPLSLSSHCFVSNLSRRTLKDADQAHGCMQVSCDIRVVPPDVTLRLRLCC